tara:strand:+ start:1732 stop:1866 length:135 start_codon:yes stop_codon:yes gene_type:complete
MNERQMFLEIERIQDQYRNGIIAEDEAIDGITAAVVFYHENKEN